MLETPFQGIDLFVFDLHTTIAPLAHSDSLQVPFRFLVEPDGYRKQYLDGQPSLTKSFDIHPLSKHSQSKNHFWKNYLGLFPAATPHVSRMQAPFICSLRQPLLTLAGNLGFAGTVRPRIYLSALGWS